jgi:outer membrane protein assembly factor BamB
MKRVLAVITFGLMVSISVGAADGPSKFEQNWPQWRGPAATGVAPHGNPPVTWSDTENVTWKVPIPGSGLSAPIVWGDRIFLTTAVRTDKPADPEAVKAAESDVPEWRRQRGIAPEWVVEFVVLAVDRNDGRIVWSKTVREAAPHEGLHTDATWASNSAVTDGEYLIAHFGSNGTYALDLDGNLKWEVDLGDMTTRNGFGEGSSPVIHGNSVVINWDHEGPSFIVALDRATGKTVWKTDRDEVTSWSTPIVVEVGGKPQVIVSATGKTRGYDLANGKVVWEAGGMTTNTIPSPVYAGGRLLVTSGFRGNSLQAIDLSAAKGDLGGTEAILWSFDQDTPYVPSPLLYNDRIYFLKHNKAILSCFDATSGKPHYGPQRLEGIEGVYASIVGAAGRVYVVGRDGNTMVIKDGPEFEVLAVNKLDDHFDASPAIAGEDIILRGRENLYRIAGGGERAQR